MSPILFILTLEQLIRQHDVYGDDVVCGEFFTVRVLGYADNAVMMDRRHTDIDHSTNNFGRCDKTRDRYGSFDAQDLLSARRQEDVSQKRKQQPPAQTAFKHKCDFCERRFKSNRDMLIHRNNCVHQYNTADETFVVEDIVGVFGRIETL